MCRALHFVGVMLQMYLKNIITAVGNVEGTDTENPVGEPDVMVGTVPCN